MERTSIQSIGSFVNTPSLSCHPLQVSRIFGVKIYCRCPQADDGFGAPVFDRTTPTIGRSKVAALNRSLTSFYRGVTADTRSLAEALPALPETADELRAIDALLAGELAHHAFETVGAVVDDVLRPAMGTRDTSNSSPLVPIGRRIPLDRLVPFARPFAQICVSTRSHMRPLRRAQWIILDDHLRTACFTQLPRLRLSNRHTLHARSETATRATATSHATLAVALTLMRTA